MPSNENLIPKSNKGVSPLKPGASLFDTLASDYDAWFEKDGKLIFETEVRAFQEILSSLPKPWLEIRVGSGRFARALGIETGIDPSIELLNIARSRGITAIQGIGAKRNFLRKNPLVRSS